MTSRLGRATTSAGNATFTDPGDAATGATAEMTVAWARLDATKKYLGRVSYADGTGEIGGTIIRVN